MKGRFIESEVRGILEKRTVAACTIIFSILFGAPGLTGCQYPDIRVQESEPLIENWLAYKAQVEDDQPFAEERDTETIVRPESVEPAEKETEEAEETEATADDAQLAQEEAKWEAIQQSKREGKAEAFKRQHGFYYSYLSDSAKVVYDEILSGLQERKETTISTLSDTQADMAFQCVLYDHPEIFYVSGYHLTQKTLDGQVVELSVTGQYEYTQEEAEERKAKIDAYVSECLAGVPDTDDEYLKVKYVFDYLITHTAYNLNAPDNQNICSVFIGGESVCQGYAESAQYLLRELGIESAIVTGLVNGGGRHAWNLVRVNDRYYYMDVTWGDVDYRATDNEQEDKLVPVNYDYFLVTTTQLEKSHVIETIVTMPDCVSEEDNYYVREGLYFEEVDEQQLASAFAGAYDRGQTTVTLKGTDGAVFEQLKHYLLDENHIFEYVDALESISYSEDTNMYTICFWLS
ncbi:MAG: hypothetical protein IJ711_01250 [Lachnospiraceae bacterium]|nr:hypothetical protein [Lachnospiraceae bacterium]